MLARLRLLTMIILAVGLMGSLAVAVPASAEDVGQTPAPDKVIVADSDDDGVLDAPGSAEATAAAAAEDKPVEDLSQRTATVTVLANPDGTYTSKQFATPIRAKQGGDWVDVDYDLMKQTDGSWAPKASPVDVSINGGSAKEAARVTFDDDTSLAVTWPTDLPEPTIDGGVATYKISESTDLLVAVTGNGVTARLRLNEQPAADDPVFTFGLRADGLDVDQTAAGGLKITDGDGKTVGTTTQLSAWDADTDASGDPADVVPLDADLTDVSSSGDVTKQDLELTAPEGYLSDPDTTYPVTVDPDISGIISHRDMWVRANDSASHAGDYRLITGRLNQSDNTSSAMSYVQFINDQLAGKDITSAKVGLWQYSSVTCADRRLAISPIASSWTSTTNWADRPDIRSTEHTYLDANRGNSSSCSDGWADLDVTAMAQKWANGTYTNYGLRLSSDGGSDATYDRRFCSRNPDTSSVCNTAAKTPYLSITYADTQTEPALAGIDDNAVSIQTPAELAADQAANQQDLESLDAEPDIGNSPEDLAGGGTDPDEDPVVIQSCTASVTISSTCNPDDVHVLAVTHVQQANYYYCGPTVGRMIAGYLGKTTSYSGLSLSMDNMARVMGTTAAAGTGMANWQAGMNDWWGTIVRWTFSTNLDDERFKKVIRGSYNVRRPMAVGTYENDGGPWYNNHDTHARPGKAIKHYLVGRGYAGSLTSTVYFVDPVAGFWAEVPKRFHYGTRSFRAAWIPSQYGAISWRS